MSTIDTFSIVSKSPAHVSAKKAGRLNRHAIRSFLAWVESTLERRRSRLALLEMTDDQLKDIGLSRADAHLEGSRQSWN